MYFKFEIFKILISMAKSNVTLWCKRFEDINLWLVSCMRLTSALNTHYKLIIPCFIKKNILFYMEFYFKRNNVIYALITNHMIGI